MKTTKTIELTEQYSAPSCKVVKTMVNRAILAVSGGENGFTVEDLEEENW